MERTIVRALTSALVLAGGLAGCAGEGSAPAIQPPALLSVPPWDTNDGGAHVPLEAGTYLIPSSAWSIADFSVTFPAGWTAQYGHAFAKHSDEEDEFGFYAVVVDEIFADACQGEGGRSRTVGPGVEDLVSALLGQGGGAVRTEPASTTLGGYSATRVDLRIPRRLDLERCQMARYGFSGLQVWYSEPADKYFVLLPGDVARVYVVDVDGERQVFLTQTGNPGSAADRDELQAVLNSIRIER